MTEEERRQYEAECLRKAKEEEEKEERDNTISLSEEVGRDYGE